MFFSRIHNNLSVGMTQDLPEEEFRSVLDEISLPDLADSVLDAWFDECGLELKRNGMSDEDVDEVIAFVDALCQLLDINIQIEVV